MTEVAAAVTELQTRKERIQIAQLNADLAAANWSQLYPFLQRLANTEPVHLLPEDVLPLMRQGRIQLWIANDATAIRAVCLTQINSLPRVRFAQILWLGALDFLPYISVLEGIEMWARELGCNYMKVNGRRGWIRALRSLGYRLYGMELLKPLIAETEH